MSSSFTRFLRQLGSLRLPGRAPVLAIMGWWQFLGWRFPALASAKRQGADRAGHSDRSGRHTQLVVGAMDVRYATVQKCCWRAVAGRAMGLVAVVVDVPRVERCVAFVLREE